MNVGIPLLAVSTGTCAIAMLSAWAFISYRAKSISGSIPLSVSYLRKFFFWFGIFFIPMGLPHIALFTNPDSFPLWMALGYTFGHIFLYVSLVYIQLMTLTIIPKLSKHTKTVIYAGIAFNVAVTVLTFVTMVLGTRPNYDYQKHVTFFNASPLVGASIGIYASISFLPPAVLFFINAMKSRGAYKVRPLLLGFGLVLMTLGGPLHDVAKTWQAFTLADFTVAISGALIALGVVYRLSEQPSIASDATLPKQTTVQT